MMRPSEHPEPRALFSPGRPLVATLLLAAVSTLAACQAPDRPRPTERLEVADVLGAGGAGFARALAPRPFTFPDDHGPHPDFAVEWWYVTGNLADAVGRRFGYQLTFFRTALQPPEERRARPSDWATEQVWMAHLAVTDAGAARFHAFERFQRGALGLAGAGARPWRVWLDDWSLQQTGDAAMPLQLRASAGEDDERVGIDLLLDPRKPLVLQGDAGFSRKGEAPGNASYYYSYTRLATSGTVRIGDREHEVDGSSWLDREWSTSALEDDQVGWDWFALQLDDGAELMFYQIRRADGSPAPTSSGALVRPDGRIASLAADEVTLQVTRTWTSPLDGSVYPIAWRLSVPRLGVDLRVTPVLEDQELDLAFRYWEGAVDAHGSGPEGGAVTGRGYVELTGYAEGRPPP